MSYHFFVLDGFALVTEASLSTNMLLYYSEDLFFGTSRWCQVIIYYEQNRFFSSMQMIFSFIYVIFLPMSSLSFPTLWIELTGFGHVLQKKGNNSAANFSLHLSLAHSSQNVRNSFHVNMIFSWAFFIYLFQFHKKGGLGLWKQALN